MWRTVLAMVCTYMCECALSPNNVDNCRICLVQRCDTYATIFFSCATEDKLYQFFFLLIPAINAKFCLSIIAPPIDQIW